MKKIVIGGRSFDLIMNMLTVDKIDEACAEGEDIQAYVQKNLSDYKKIPDMLPVLLSANNDDVPDAKWFKRNMTMGMAAHFAQLIMQEFISAMAMETNEEDDGPIDVGLREIRKKEKADG